MNKASNPETSLESLHKAALHQRKTRFSIKARVGNAKSSTLQ